MKVDRRILLVEEDFEEVFLLERAFRAAGIMNPVQIARHIQEAICYLRGVGIYGDRKLYPLPSLILLSLRLPTGVGFQLLSWIRARESFNGLPIVALGGARSSIEAQKAFNLGANAYFERNKDKAEIVHLIQELELLEDVWDHCDDWGGPAF